MSKIQLIIALLMLIGFLTFFVWRGYVCDQKKCPDGLKPYLLAYTNTCACIKEAE